MNPVPGAVQASSVHLKNLAHLCHICPSGGAAVLNELFCALVERLHETWKAMRAVENCSVMDFTRALREVYVANAAFWQSRHVDIAEICELRNHLRIQIGPRKSLSGVLKVHCKHVRQRLGSHIARTKNAVGKVLFTESSSSQVASMDMRQKLLDTQETRYQPPDSPAVVTYAPPLLRGPVARPADGLDVDAFFENLGLGEEKLIGKEKAPQPEVWNQIMALEENLNGTKKDPHPTVWDQIIASDQTLEQRLTPDARDVNAFLKPCLSSGPQKVSLLTHVGTRKPEGNLTEHEALWQDFGNW